jgi:hypothetical protein
MPCGLHLPYGPIFWTKSVLRKTAGKNIGNKFKFASGSEKYSELLSGCGFKDLVRIFGCALGD